MNYKIIKIIMMLIFAVIYEIFGEIMHIHWIFFVCGFSVPFIRGIIRGPQIYTDFPWEIYVFYGIVILNIFIEVDPVLIFLGHGYTVSRIGIYFFSRAKRN